ncbi:MFS transporter [Priestia megaterium]|uniref:MFS transporter n=1 Tax=Priestia TaxID=2800373 RepID=UPI001C8E43EF|nr:MFS transporter [Priestia aryabhattai]MBK0295876.1 MFS transporter [Bacillus sp. S34]MBY0029762.1 MFS transporter [Priestia aryabhattai]
MLKKISFSNLGIGTWLIIIIQFIAFFTFFMFVPFISTYFVNQLGFSLAFVGTVLSLRIISQQGLMIFGGFLADRFGYKQLAVTGFVCRGIGFAGLGLTNQPILIIIAAILSGLGGAMFSPALKAALTMFTPPERSKEAFSMMNMVENGGTVMGPLVGLFFKQEDFFIMCLISGFLFWLIGFIVLFLPNPPVLKRHSSWIQETFDIMRHKIFILLVISLMPFHFIYQQLYLTFPIISEKVTGSSSWIFSFITINIILLQVPILHWFKNHSMKTIFILPYIFIGLSLFILGYSEQLLPLIIVLVSISFGSMLLLPFFQDYVAEIAPKESLAAYFGFSNMAMGIGGSLGNLLGGVLYDLLKPEWFWIILSMICILPIIGVTRLKHTNSKRIINKNVSIK